ncbi:DUF5959 family protein [Streptomyces sp. NPDC001777]|uniref:DUF5959 family protein n=1 Tax=Streptomyces sp. NPDC001777 TaxID=3364608 RepID=UPI00368AD44F
MTTEPAPVDLVRLADGEGNSCVVRVTGRSRPGVLTGHDVLRADVLVSTSFLDARLDVYLFPQDLDAWQEGLPGLVPGRQIGLGGDRGLRLVLRVHEGGLLTVSIVDPDRLTTLLGIRPEGDWLAELRESADRVGRTWPVEVVETSPMTYEWSPDRKR